MLSAFAWNYSNGKLLLTGSDPEGGGEKGGVHAFFVSNNPKLS